jgi:hypothetical protein
VEDLAQGLSSASTAQPAPPFAEFRYLAASLGEVLLASA